MACKWLPWSSPTTGFSPTSTSAVKLPPSFSIGFHLPPTSRRRRLSSSTQAHNKPVDSVSTNPSSSLKKRPVYPNLKSFFEKKSLWRRIVFASTKVRSIMLLNVITLIYASNISVVKEVEAITDPAAFTVVRFVVCAIPFLPFVWQAKDDVDTRNAGIELGFWVSLGYLMQALGLLTSDAGRASFLTMFTVIVVPLLDGMLGAVVPARTWFGAVMSIVGVGLLESSGSPPDIGDLWNFLSAVFFGVHMLRTEHVSRSTNMKNFLPLLGYEMAAMQDVSATETAIIYGLEPVWGACFAWFLLGERWGANGWIGAFLVLAGSLTVQ